VSTEITHVTTNGDAPKVAPVPEQDVRLREQLKRYILEHSEEWHREHLGKLATLWERYNVEHFASEMVVPVILLNEPSNPRRLGDCGPFSGMGCRSQIRIRPSLLTGTHPSVNGNKEGRFLFVADVLLHEMIHQWQQEVSGDTDVGYHGHGPAFRDKANEIGRRLGLGPVRTCKARGKDKDLPSCSQWPHNVRASDYYLGAYVPTSGDKAGTLQVPPEIHAFAKMGAARFDPDELCRLIREYAVERGEP
jgi:hypothetical protein